VLIYPNLVTKARNLLVYKVYTNSCAIVYENNTATLHHVCSEFGMCFILTVTTIHGQGRRATEGGFYITRVGTSALFALQFIWLKVQ